MSISSFKATCLAVLDRVAKTGQPVLITRRGQPVAEVVPPGPKVQSDNWLGYMRSYGGSASNVESYDLAGGETALVEEWDELNAAPPKPANGAEPGAMRTGPPKEIGAAKRKAAK